MPADRAFKGWLLIPFLWLVVLLPGALHALADRHAMNADGISYVDIAQAAARGEWKQIVNGYWSPLYPALLGAALAVIKPPPPWEAGVAHLVNFAIYGFALLCFHWFWLQVIRYQRVLAERSSQHELPEQSVTLPEWAWWALGYALFAWSALNLVTMRLVNPDLLVAGFVYLIMALIGRIRLSGPRWRLFILLGLALGGGYLAKTVMFVMAFVFAAVALLAAGHLRKAIPRVAAALLIFLLVGGPYIAALSREKGRLTYGDSGKLNHGPNMAGLPAIFHWQGEDPATGTPKHPPRKLHDDPAIYEFAKEGFGTYPFWYDPSYWFDGFCAPFNLSAQSKLLLTNLGTYFEFFYREQGFLLAGFLGLLLMRANWRSLPTDLARQWWLLLPALAALGLYALVALFPRYVAAYLVIFWASVFGAVRLPATLTCRRLLRCVCGITLLALAAAVGYASLPAIKQAASDLRQHTDTAPHMQWKVAEAAARMGLRPGEQVGHIGSGLKSWSYWAHLAGVRITAELVPEENFWTADDAARARAIEVFAKTGVKALVAHVERPAEIKMPHWQRMGNTNHYLYFLPAVPRSSASAACSSAPAARSSAPASSGQAP